MAVTAKVLMQLQVKEVLALALDVVGNPEIVHELADPNVTLTGSTTPPVTKVYSDERQLTAGAVTVDLAALPGPLGTTMDFTGLKVQGIKIVADPTNTARLEARDGATNGYDIFGFATGEISLGPGEVAQFHFRDTLQDVAAGDKTIDFASSDTDAKFKILIVAG